MSVNYKFKCAKEFKSVSIDYHIIYIGELKGKIYKAENLALGKPDFDLEVSNAQTNEVYVDGDWVPTGASLLIRRIPRLHRKSIAVEKKSNAVGGEVGDLTAHKGTSFHTSVAQPALVPDTSLGPEESGSDDFGPDVFVKESKLRVLPCNAIQNDCSDIKCEDQSKIILASRKVTGSGGGMINGVKNGRVFGGNSHCTSQIPPQGYVCHRCKVPGHFIYHCPTNGDANYDAKRSCRHKHVSPVRGTPDTQCATSEVFVQTQERKTILPSEIHPELCCPLCKALMEDAAFTSKCCFQSFCARCINDYIISKSRCVCGARNVVVNDVVPNKTIQATIKRIIVTKNSIKLPSAGDVESACPPSHSRDPSSTLTFEENCVPCHGDDKSACHKGHVCKFEDEMLSAAEQLCDHSTRADVSPEYKGTRVLKVKGGNFRGREKLRLSTSATGKKRKTNLNHAVSDVLWETSEDASAGDFMLPSYSSLYGHSYFGTCDWPFQSGGHLIQPFGLTSQGIFTRDGTGGIRPKMTDDFSLREFSDCREGGKKVSCNDTALMRCVGSVSKGHYHGGMW